MSYLAGQIDHHCSPADSTERLIVYRTGSHAGYLTYDGVDVNGKRISDEIWDHVEELKLQGNQVTKFSLIGYSMGGLVSRYAIGVLYHRGFFEKVRPCHFTTFCTPHVGALNASSSLSARLYNLVAPYVLVHTGKQMFLKDAMMIGGSKKPLLEWMADPSSTFHKALSLFDHRHLYANTINDRRTAWYTTSISPIDPFQFMVNEKTSAYVLGYVEGYEPTVIDISKLPEFNKVEATVKQFSFLKLLSNTLLWLKLAVYFVFLAPLYGLYVLGNSICQRIMLSKRMRDFSNESAESLQVLYDTIGGSLISEDGAYAECHLEDHSLSKVTSRASGLSLGERVRDQTESLVDSILDAMSNDNYSEYQQSVLKKKKTTSVPELNSDSDHLVSDSGRTLIDLRGKSKANFDVQLTEIQETIIENLNKLEWNKFPVIIRQTKATHAAVIYRHEDPTFDEGKVVVEHFVKEILKI